MALSILEVLHGCGEIDQDALARAFSRRYADEPWRGYAGGAEFLLRRLGAGEDWRTVAPALFDGGSYGNGAAMRAAPIGGSFWQDPERAVLEAQRSAVITHAHPEGQAGAIAVAAAAALAAQPLPPTGTEFLRAVLPLVPSSETRHRIKAAIDLPGDALQTAVARLGSGQEVSAQDTVPFCLWCAAHHLHDFKEALWWTLRGMGDCDTTCAIVGGIVSLAVSELPDDWLQRRESLPA